MGNGRALIGYNTMWLLMLMMPILLAKATNVVNDATMIIMVIVQNITMATTIRTIEIIIVNIFVVRYWP